MKVINTVSGGGPPPTLSLRVDVHPLAQQQGALRLMTLCGDFVGMPAACTIPYACMVIHVANIVYADPGHPRQTLLSKITISKEVGS